MQSRVNGCCRAVDLADHSASALQLAVEVFSKGSKSPVFVLGASNGYNLNFQNLTKIMPEA
jgi:hypothetical protein